VCPSPSASPLPLAASAHAVTLRILNTTKRDGLARTVKDELVKRGFRVAGIGNAKPPFADPAQVRYDAATYAAARLLAENVVGARLVEDPTVRGLLVLRIGNGFTRLATPAEVGAAHTHDQAQTTPLPVPTTSCRPR
jgi:hypothetical protein